MFWVSLVVVFSICNCSKKSSRTAELIFVGWWYYSVSLIGAVGHVHPFPVWVKQARQKASK